MIFCICGGVLELLLLVSGVGALIQLVRRLVRRMRSRTFIGIDPGMAGGDYNAKATMQVDPDGKLTVLACEHEARGTRAAKKAER